jgi:hypothetical protein
MYEQLLNDIKGTPSIGRIIGKNKSSGRIT